MSICNRDTTSFLCDRGFSSTSKRPTSNGKMFLTPNPNRLNPYARQVLLEQTLRVVDSDKYTSPSLFCKTMFAGRRYFYTAKDRPVYRLAIKTKAKRAVIGFLSSTSLCFHPIRYKFEKAKKFISLLSPRHTNMSVHLKDEQYSVFLDLLPILEGKLELVFTEACAVAPFIIYKTWSKLSVLECNACEIDKDTPTKKFDILSAKNIKNMDELQNVLRHDTKELRLSFHDDFVADPSKPIQNVGKIDTCCIEGEGNTFSKAVQVIASNCSTLKKLICNDCHECVTAHRNTAGEIIGDIIKNYNAYEDAIQHVSQLKTETDINAVITYTGDKFQLHHNWTDNLLHHPDFQNVDHKTTVADDGEVTTTFTAQQQRDNFSASFRIEVRYEYAEEINVEQNPEEVDVDQTVEDLLVQAFQEIFG